MNRSTISFRDNVNFYLYFAIPKRARMIFLESNYF